MKNWKVIINRINTVRLAKKLFLPFKLLGIDREQILNTYGNDYKVSSI